MKGALDPPRTWLYRVCGLPVNLSLHYAGLSICQHNKDVYNHTSDALFLPPLSPLSSSFHKHSCQLSITGGRTGRIGEYVMTTYIMASWQDIAKPLWLWLNCACCALHLLSKQEACLFSMSGHGGGTSASHPCGGAVELCLLQVWHTPVDSALHWSFILNIKHRAKWEEGNGRMTEMEGWREGERERERFYSWNVYFLCKIWHNTVGRWFIAHEGGSISAKDEYFGAWRPFTNNPCCIIIYGALRDWFKMQLS